MCTITKIIRNEHTFSDLYWSRNDSALDWYLYYKFCIYLKHKCKCEKNKFELKDWTKCDVYYSDKFREERF